MAMYISCMAMYEYNYCDIHNVLIITKLGTLMRIRLSVDPYLHHFLFPFSIVKINPLNIPIWNLLAVHQSFHVRTCTLRQCTNA